MRPPKNSFGACLENVTGVKMIKACMSYLLRYFPLRGIHSTLDYPYKNHHSNCSLRVFIQKLIKLRQVNVQRPQIDKNL